MNFLPIIILVAAICVVGYLFMNKKSESTDREGVVRDVLKKDALSVDFGDGVPVVVKFAGVSPATEGEMLDDKIIAFLDQSLRGKQVVVKPVLAESSQVVSGEVRTAAGEYVNAALLAQGFGRWLASEAPNDAELSDAQQRARSSQLGVWNPAVIQLLADRNKAAESMSDDDISNMSIDPDAEEGKA